jgi:hypothetical protein
MKVYNQDGKEYDVTSIPDLWHAAMYLREKGQDHYAEMVLKAWHQAHAMKDTLHRLEGEIDFKPAETQGELML